jgi:hypothetical protein
MEKGLFLLDSQPQETSPKTTKECQKKNLNFKLSHSTELLKTGKSKLKCSRTLKTDPYRLMS